MIQQDDDKRQRYMKAVRSGLFDQLWQHYLTSIPYWSKIWPESDNMEYPSRPHLDHLAIIDLPIVGGGIAGMRYIAEVLGFKELGSGYLEAKHNRFIWMAAEDCSGAPLEQTLPQLVLADFDIEKMVTRKIIERYISQASNTIHKFYANIIATSLDPEVGIKAACSYFHQQPWPLPTVADYLAVKEENELMAWVLARGRMVNHFGISLHLHNDHYSDLHHCNQQLRNRGVLLNEHGGVIRGGEEQGIAQSATVGHPINVQLADGVISLTDSFVELVWRYPTKGNPKLWGDYSTHFIADNANTIIESLYSKD